jgi:ATP adenylyltransferase
MVLPPLDQIIAVFDELVAEGVIAYGPYQVIEKDCDGYPVSASYQFFRISHAGPRENTFSSLIISSCGRLLTFGRAQLEFRICPSLTQKPPSVGAAMNIPVDESQKWGPGSDMYCLDNRLRVARLNNTHDLVFNLFCADRPQFLLLTTDSYRRQNEPLDCTDFEAALSVLRSFDEMYVTYTCTVKAGSSREHKHMQAVRGPPRAFDMFIDPVKKLKIPFQYESYHSEATFGCTKGSDLSAIYDQLLGRTKEALGLRQDDTVCPHNVVLWKDWMIVIPRRATKHGQAGANSAGMLGSIWILESRLIDEWQKLGYREVLQTIGLPSGR